MTEAMRGTRGLRPLVVLLFTGLVLWALRGLPKQLGAVRANPVRSPRFTGGRFRNPVPTDLVRKGSVPSAFREQFFGGQQRTPRRPVPVLTPDFGRGTRTDGLVITWMRHASALVEIEGTRVLFDPVWSERCSPVGFAGPRRLHRNPVELHDLPPVDAVVISHDHYDHLDMATIKSLAANQDTRFIVPLGVGAHLERWNVPIGRVTELDWGDSTGVVGIGGSGGAITLTATGARHSSGRGWARDTTLWASWAVRGQARSLFYTGDSGYWSGYRSIGEEHGPFDVSMVQTGAYNDAWPDVHMTPEQGIAVHLDVRARLLLPLHWCTFTLAPHDWAEPAERLCAAASAQDIALVVPRPGQRVDVDAPPALDPWWRDVM
ncbi:MBL fold metallo-hydrolase [Lentzea sp. NPDC060358]|uniref:MBL fold metallo-hydrolase n=1 Tax=Lentzea sp. NPDC060358 TaxID=3347103 RepID=UPI003660C7C8